MLVALVVVIGGGMAFYLRGPMRGGRPKDTSVWAWGGNDNEQLGDGTMTDRSAPFQVPGPNNAVVVSAGDGHSLEALNKTELLLKARRHKAGWDNDYLLEVLAG